MSESFPVSPYRWVILAIAGGIMTATELAQFQIAALAFKLIPGLHLTPSQFAMVMLAGMLPAIFLSFVAGGLADRFGVKAVVFAGFIFSVPALYFRYTADNFGQLFIIVILSGMVSLAINVNAPKLLAYWFPAEWLSTAMGVYMACLYAGMTIGLSTTPLFPSVKSAFIFGGLVMLALWILWGLFVRNKPKGMPDMPVVPVTRYMGVAARSKNVWLAGICLFLLLASDMAYAGFFPNALHAARHLSPEMAGFVVSFITFGELVGALVIPPIIKRSGRTKPFLVPAAFVVGIVMMATWLVPSVGGMVTLLAVAGILTGPIVALIFAMAPLFREIGPVYAGSAVGIMGTLQVIGGFAVPSFVIAPVSGHNYTLMFLITSVLFVLIGVVALFLPETGTKVLSARQETGRVEEGAPAAG